MNDLLRSHFPTPPSIPPTLSGPWKGVVEQRTDPERKGRLKVRVAGFFDTIPVEDLPWLWPDTSACVGAGFFFIPPVGAVVWVTFENADCEYGKWSGGWWGKDEIPEGKGVTAHRQWPTSFFGGRHSDGVLALEKASGVKAEDAPDNFAFVSPLQKRLELDDRGTRERIVLADRHDNFLWINSEDGVMSFEAVGGEQSGGYFPYGLTLSSKSGEQAIQAYTFQGWQWTLHDTQQTAELMSPRGNRFRMSDKDKKDELWSIKGLRLVLDDTTDSLQFLTQSGVGLFVKGKKLTIATDPDNYLTFDLQTGNVTLKCAGDFRLHSGGDTVITANGKVTIDGTQNVYWNTFPFTEPPAVPVDPVFTKPEPLAKIKRAPDYPYYSTP